MDFDAVFTVKKEFSKDAFLRELIIELGTQNETPVDIVNAKFGDVKESVREAIVCTAQVEGSCTASVGYDRQEPYTDYETYREKVGDSYVTRQRAVTKYRTVTDWRLFQTQYSGEATCAAYNSDEFGFDDSGIVSAIKSAKNDSIVEKGDATVNLAGLDQAVAACESHVEWSSVSFPGDRHKDVNFNSDSTIQSISCYKLPYYEVTYKYNDKDYTASCFACGDINIYAETPPNDIDITDIVIEKTKKQKKVQKISWIIFIISLIFAAILCIGLKFGWLFPIPIVLLLKAKKDSEKYSKEYQNCSDDLSKNVANSKVAALKTALEKRGYEPLSQDLNNSLEGTAVPGAKALKPIKSRVTWSWVFAIILSVISVFTIVSSINQDLHSPKQLEISKILTVPVGIGLIGLLFSGFMFMMLFKITTVLKKLECKNCHEQVTYNDSIKYKILREWEEKKVTSNNNGRTNVSQTEKAEVLVTCACQNCGTPKEFKHEFRTANYYNGSLKYSYQIEELIEGMFTGKLIQ